MAGLNRRERFSVSALAIVLGLDAVYNVIPNRWVDEDLDRLRVPRALRFVLASSKGAGAVGLLLQDRRPGLARLAAGCLVLYFSLAIGAHARVHDDAWRYASATALLGWSGLTFTRLSRTGAQAGTR